MLVCKRCLYKSKRKSNLINHLTKNKVCAVNILGGVDVSRDTLLNSIEDNTSEYPCRKNCGAYFKNDKTRRFHEMSECSLDTTQSPVESSIPLEVDAGFTSCITEFKLSLSDARIEVMFDDFNGFEDGLISYIKRLYFNPLNKLGQSIWKLDKNDKFMQVFDGAYWKNEFSHDCVSEMFIDIGKRYEGAKYCARNMLFVPKIPELNQRICIPLHFDWKYEIEWGRIHRQPREDLYQRVYDLIAEQTDEQLLITHSTEIKENCMCVYCRRDFDNLHTEAFQFTEIDFW